MIVENLKLEVQNLKFEDENKGIVFDGVIYDEKGKVENELFDEFCKVYDNVAKFKYQIYDEELTSMVYVWTIDVTTLETELVQIFKF